MDSYDQISILLLKHTKLKRFKHAKTTAPTICNHQILGDILRPESPLYKHKLLSKDDNLWVKQQVENMIDFEFTIYMPWQTVPRVPCYVAFERGRPEEIYHPVESGDNCKGNDDIFENYPRTVFSFVTSVEQKHNYNGLEKVQYRCNCLPRKM